MSTKKPLILKIQLSVVEQLGINLYSNTPAVLSELVANAWDADAKNVDIRIDVTKGTIVIIDDGFGMDRTELQDKYLNVGFKKRGANGEHNVTPGGRPVMGRKGIGKLSVFAISKRATVETVKKRTSASSSAAFKGGVVLEIDKIREAAIMDKSYEPREIAARTISISKGTKITLVEPTKTLSQTVKALRTRLARRFSVIGSKGFCIKVNKVAITPVDRDYFHRLQYVSWLGLEEQALYEPSCRSLDDNGVIEGGPLVVQVPSENGKKTIFETATGWIGFAKETGQMTDEDDESLNRIILMVRGKLAQEDLLPLLSENRVGKSYLMGEIHADFLDKSDLPDIAVASRQGIKEDDGRYKALITALTERVKSIVSERDKRKEKKSEQDILKNVVVKEWFDSLDDSDKPFAKKMLKGVSKATEIDLPTKETFVKHTIVAFEQMRYSNRLQELDHLDENHVEKLVEVFGDINRLEAAMYSEIVIGRIAAIDKLQSLLDENALEKAYQSLLAKNPWLLDTSWERATEGDIIVEKSIKAAWGELQNHEDLEKGRVDLAYQIVNGDHLIIELKRADRAVAYEEVYTQVTKYKAAFKRAMKVNGTNNAKCKIQVILGKPLKGWSDSEKESEETDLLQNSGIKICYYQELASRARKAYKDYLAKQHKVNTIRNILDRIKFSEDFSE